MSNECKCEDCKNLYYFFSHVSCKENKFPEEEISKEDYERINNMISEERECSSFNSRYITYPIEVEDIELNNEEKPLKQNENTGRICRIRCCGKDDTTYLGFYLGECPISNTVNYYKDTKILKVGYLSNPAIFVPKLNRVVYGCESWWNFIKDPDNIENITDELINDQWYMKMVKNLGGNDEN